MESLEFSLASACPMDCHYCPQRKLAAAYTGPKLMAMETFEAVIKNAGAVEVYSFAGFAEPYLNPLCTSMIRAASDKGPVTLYTTAVGMTPDDVAEIRGKVKWMTVHLPDAEGNMKFTPTPAYLKTIIALKNSGMDVRWMSMGKVHGDVGAIVGKVPDVSMQSRAGNVSHMVQIRNHGPLKCGPAPRLDHPVVLPSGDVVVCCQDYSLDHVIGNLAAQTWDEIRRGKAFVDLVAAMESEDGECLCRRCSYAVRG